MVGVGGSFWKNASRLRFFLLMQDAVPGRALRVNQEGSDALWDMARHIAVSPLFQAVVEATEEAIYNSLFRATTMKGQAGHVVEALPLERTLEILRRHGAVK